MNGVKREPEIVANLAFDLLKDAEISYKLHHKFLPDVLQSLHDVFGNVLIHAAELLESSSFIKYQTKNMKRQLLKIVNRIEQYTLFVDINFCHCQAFKNYVLITKSTISCKHVLAAKLATICGKFKVEIITDTQLTDLLNYHYEQFVDLSD